MSETFTYDNLIAGCQKDIVQSPATFRTFEAISRGEVVGKLTATHKWQKLAVASIASFEDVGIAVEAVDTTDGTERNTTVYVEGEFNENHVIFDYSNTADDWRATLADHGIYLRDSISTAGV